MNLGRAPAGALAALLLLCCSCIAFPDAKGYSCQAVADCGAGRSCAEGQCVDLAPLAAGEPHYGNTMGQWAVTWATWWLSQPDTGDNPMNDLGGGQCNAGQDPHSPVFLLTQAAQNDVPGERTCDAVAGKAMLLPLFWWIDDNQGVDPGTDSNGKPFRESEQSLSDTVSGWSDEVSKLVLEIDDKPFPQLRAFRIHPQRFSFDEDATAPFNTPAVDQTNHVDPAFIDGFFVLLPPLPSGEHKLHFGSEYYDPFQDVTRSIDMTYHMVIP